MIGCYFQIPKSFSKKKREQALAGDIQPTKKPDLDNILKVVCDALNKVAYNDDAQCVGAILSKGYSDTEYIEVKLINEDYYKEVLGKKSD